MTAIDVVAVAGSLAVLVLVLSLIVRRRLKPRYALLWLIAAVALVGVSVWRDSIDIVGAALGIDYKPVVVFLATDLFVLLVLLHMSLVVSRLTDQVRTLAQEIALLHERIRRAEDHARVDADDTGGNEFGGTDERDTLPGSP